MKLRTTTQLYARHDAKPAFFRNVPIIGFRPDQAEAVRAVLSRIPAQLLTNVSCIEAHPEMGARHGRFLPKTKTIWLNPHSFELRQRFGKGQGWINHNELVVAHEVGHSVFDNLPVEQQDEFKAISGWQKGTGEGQAPPYVEKRPGWPAFTADWTHKKGVGFTRGYAEKSPEEDAADSFAMFLMGKAHQMAPGKRDFWQRIFESKVTVYPHVMVQSPEHANQERVLKNKFVE